LTQPANEHRSGVEGQAHGAGRLRLQEVAAALARDHNLASRPRPAPSPLDRLQTLGNLLQAAHAEYVHVSESEEMLSGAAEWLLDNHYIVRQAMRQVRKNVPGATTGGCPNLGVHRGKVWPASMSWPGPLSPTRTG
jgi:hypothetical protein